MGGLYVKKFLVLIVAAVVLMTANVLAANYVGNANSGKFHYADCSSLKRMNPNNRVDFSSRDEAVAAGYIPCKRCKP